MNEYGVCQWPSDKVELSISDPEHKVYFRPSCKMLKETDKILSDDFVFLFLCNYL